MSKGTYQTVVSGKRVEGKESEMGKAKTSPLMKTLEAKSWGIAEAQMFRAEHSTRKRALLCVGRQKKA